MDGIGTASAILQLSGTAVKASWQLYNFIVTVQDAPRELCLLRDNVQALAAVLSNLEGSLKSPETQKIVDQDSEIRNNLDSLQYFITRCEVMCRQLTECLRSYIRNENTDKASIEGKDGDNSPTAESPVSMGSINRITWYFKRKDVLLRVSELQRTKELFSDAMGSLTLLLMMRISRISAGPDDSALPVISNGHPFDDDAGSAIVLWANTVQSQSLLIDGTSTSSTQTLSRPGTPRPADPELARELFEAVKRNSIPLVEYLLDRVDINTRRPRDGRTALSFAAELGYVKMTKFLLDHGALVNIRQYTRTCADSKGPTFIGGRTPLHWAADSRASAKGEIIQLLLDHGANPNAATSAGRPALQFVCIQGDCKSARILLDRGADVNFRSFHHGWCAVNEVAHFNHTELLKVLLEYNPLLDVTVDLKGDRKAPLHSAVCNRNHEFMNLLLENGADPDIGMFEGNTPLHLAAAMGWLEGINILLDSNASMDSQDDFLFETPLHKAARNRKVKACQLLCQRGANSAIQNIDGLDYQSILKCTQRYPDDWKVNQEKVYFLS
ncbi:ankyrin repeat-containing domain protein [Aspergillus pseudocaelatus]|uniref:Ankyrin repeat-containing domain protein n=1 Tax=Aspergillus pseudocaelatus TaxID=1825620 RepID=A0ABQ6X394_9EURO|nr:ankyrin repeat-containing domain protein [Aspergillus pseudocaelatus]